MVLKEMKLALEFHNIQIFEKQKLQNSTLQKPKKVVRKYSESVKYSKLQKCQMWTVPNINKITH
jgi:hypothetical protein